jgi:hypothetical protein
VLRLLITHGHEEHVLAVPEGEALLGSATDNDIVLRVPGVSRRHARLRRIPGGIEVLDRESKNHLFVAGQQVRRAVLTPGLRVQVGAAWLEIEEVSSAEQALALLSRSSSELLPRPGSATVTADPEADSHGSSPADAALALAHHIAQVGVGVPGQRKDLLARIKATLGAEAFASFDRRRRGKLRVWESEGGFLPEETELLSALVEGAGDNREQVILKRTGPLLLAGCDSWFLGAKFADEALAREGWRKELLRVLAHQLFPPVRSLDAVDSAEAHRVLALVRRNKTKAARLLDRSRGTLNKLLTRHDSPKR